MEMINFNSVFYISSILWILASIITFVKNKYSFILSNLFSLAGSIFLLFFIIDIWVDLNRPPMRTLGETRLWYSLFLSVIGVLINIKWKYKLLFVQSMAFSILFLSINYLSPEAFSKTLMPALQSVFFVPHVVVYILAYSILGFAGIIALTSIIKKKSNYEITDNLVYLGFGFLSLGLIFGAVWAKEAWGHYWTWDPKETWAFITWAGYLIYIHFRLLGNSNKYNPNYILIISFVLLLLCWFGVNYMPSASFSVHTYSNY